MIVSVTVTFAPDLAALRRQLISLRGQVDASLVIDNGPGSADLTALCTELSAGLTALQENMGIGHAQNLGVQQARSRGADMVLLMDQDSEPQPAMVPALAQVLQRQPQAAAAGPRLLDLRNGQLGTFLTDTGSTRGRWSPLPAQAGQTTKAAYLIASGCLLRVEAWDDVGPMRADWFIDHLDTEWFLRARAKGWSLIGVADAVLGHRLGDRVTRLWWGRMRQIPYHSPARFYTMFRNALLLMQEPHVAWHWKRHHALALCQLAVFFLAAESERLLRLRMMVRGLVHGVQRRTGPPV